MIFYGLLGHETEDIIDFYPDRESAEAELAEILADEPVWITKLEVVRVDFSGAEVDVRSVLGGL